MRRRRHFAAFELDKSAAGTRSFVLLCDDPDAPGGTWHHWAVYDLPASERSIAEGASRHPNSFKQAINDFQKSGYGGPCPPEQHGLHHYHFRLLALSVERLPVQKGATCRDVEREARNHVLAQANLIAVYERLAALEAEPCIALVAKQQRPRAPQLT